MRITKSLALAVFPITAFACSSGSSSVTTSQPDVLTASPSSLYFPVTFDPTPSAMTITGTRALDAAFSVSVADPTLVGYSKPSIAGKTATLSVFALAPGSTSISFSDRGRPATVNTASDKPCGRPPNLSYNSTLLAPAPGSTSVPTSVGTLYFAVYSQVSPQANLHIIVGAHQSFEAGALSLASPPPGTPTAPPLSGQMLTYMEATIPTLAPATSYRTQLYADPCEAALLTGAFST